MATLEERAAKAALDARLKAALAGLETKQPADTRDPLQRAVGIVSTGLQEGVSGLAGLPNVVGSYLATAKPSGPGADPAAASRVGAAGEFLQKHTYSPEEINAGITSLTNVQPTEPQEASGRILKAYGRGVGGGFPFGIAGLAGGGLAATAEQGAEEAGLPRWAQLVAGMGLPLLYGGIRSSVRGIMPSANKQIGEALRGVTEQQMFAAEQLMRQAQQAGNPVTWSEALNQATRGRFPMLANLQRVAEQSPGGSNPLARVMSQRLDAAKAQAEGALSGIAPQPTGQALADVPADLQQAAKAVFNREIAGMRATTKPLYAAASRETVDPTELARIVKAVDTEIASAGSEQVKAALVQFRKELVEAPATAARAPAMGPLTGQSPTAAVPEQYKLDIGRLDSIRKAWRDKIELPDPNINAAAVPKEVGARLGPILGDLRDTMSRTSASYKAARKFHQDAMQKVIEPLQRNITGQIADAPATLSAQRQRLLPIGKQETVDPANVASTVRNMEAAKPNSAKTWLRANLQSEFDDILKAFKTASADESRGASLWAAISGNEARRGNLRAYVEALPNGKDTWAGFERMLQVLDAQRYRLPGNSATAFNQETIRALQGKGIPVSLEDLNPVSFLGGEVKQGSKLRRYRINSEKLANLLLDPDAGAQLRALAKMSPMTAGARRLSGAILVMGMPDDEQ